MADPSTKGGIKVRNLHKSLRDRLFAASGQKTKVGLRPGACAFAQLYVPANVVNGDPITIGADTFEVDIINTDSAVNTANAAEGALNGTDTQSLVTLGAAPATAISAGDVIRIENELMLVVRKLTTTTYVVYRRYAGSTEATHAQNLDVFVSDSVPTNISIPLVTTLTPAAFSPAFVGVFNWSKAAGDVRPARTATEGASKTAGLGARTAMPTVGLGPGAAGQTVLIVNNNPGVDTTAVSEDFANSTDNVWVAATFTGGLAAAVVGAEMVERVPTSAEVLGGEMHFPFGFTVRSVLAMMRITSTGEQLAFNGLVLIGYAESTDATLPTTIVTLRNVGPASTAYITEFATTHTVVVWAAQ